MEMGSPFGGNEAHRLDHALMRGFRCQFASVKHGNGIGGHVCHVEPGAIAVQGQGDGFRAKVALAWEPGVEVALERELGRTGPWAHNHRSDGVAICQGHV